MEFSHYQCKARHEKLCLYMHAKPGGMCAMFCCLRVTPKWQPLGKQWRLELGCALGLNVAH
jgi:hypothetical protein